MAWRALGLRVPPRTRRAPPVRPKRRRPWTQSEVERPRLWDTRLIIFLVVVLVLVASSFFLFPGNSDFRWGVLIWVLVVTGIFVFVALYRTGVRVPPLEPPPKEEFAFKGELDHLAQMLDRADRGMRYSQVAVALRVRTAFLTRLRAERGLGDAEMAALLASSEGMDRIVSDPTIQEFLEDTAVEEEALIRQHSPNRSPAFRFALFEGFNPGLDRVLEAMEAWL